MGSLGPSVIILCSSLDKPCGIARYTTYVVEQLKAAGRDVAVVATSDAVVKLYHRNPVPTVILVQHEYGLFDSHSELGTGESTTEVITNLSYLRGLPGFEGQAAFIFHTLSLADHVLNTLNKQIFSSGFPVFHLNEGGVHSAQVNFMEHGVYRPHDWTAPPNYTDLSSFRVGAFGLLSPNKDLKSLFELCVDAGVSLHANFACVNEKLKEKQLATMREMGVRGTLQFDFLSEDNLTGFLKHAHVIYLPQHDFPHFATSGSARFALGCGRPLIVPAHKPFHDLVSGVLFADVGGAVSLIRGFAEDNDRYLRSVERVTEFVDQRLIHQVYGGMIDALMAKDYVVGGYSPLQNNLVYIKPQELLAGNGKIGRDLSELQSRRYRTAATAISRSGQAPLHGKLYQTIVGWGDNHTETVEDPTPLDPRGEPERDLSQASAALERARELESRWLEVCTKNSRWDATQLPALLADYGGTGNPLLGSRALLRLFGLDCGWFPILEFVDLPTVVQMTYLSRSGTLDDKQLQTVSQMLVENREAAAWREPSLSSETLRGILELYASQPFWGDARMRLRWSERFSFEYRRHDPVRHPAGVLADGNEKFLICAYLSILGRLPDPSGFKAYMQHLTNGLPRWNIVDAFTKAPEYRKRGSAWLYGDAELLSTADLARSSSLQMLDAACPEKLRDDLANFRYWDIVQMDRYGEVLQALR